MLTTEQISGFKYSLCELTLYALKKEYVRGQNAIFEWMLAQAISATISLVESDPENQAYADKLACLISMMPPKCLPVPIFTTTGDCEMTVGLDIITQGEGNPCENFSVNLAIY